MGAQRQLIPLLLLLAVLCSTGVSLRCYSCIDPVSSCKMNTTCSINMDSCLIAVTGRQHYHQCWRLRDCNTKFLLDRFQLSNVRYRCCQVDLCNKKLEEEQEEEDKQKAEATSLSGKTALLGTLVLEAMILSQL
ncbi:CD59 glycoprotein [Meriones unguiculatus]|uniref:CD59 glycoprotein n=1 Tax=Meriones unguiculatus TaxID=10047 RepID=UPI000B4F3A8A|nr:CD59 glycoprotein [Meriones unguiculatus]